MGCFSFMCTKCGRPINSDSFSGENVRLSLLEDGKVIEEMQGPYDSYGRVFDENGESIEWGKDWGDVCDIMFDSNPKSGMSAVHVACVPDEIATEVSKSDRDQGWGIMEPIHMGKCEIYHSIMFRKI